MNVTNCGWSIRHHFRAVIAAERRAMELIDVAASGTAPLGAGTNRGVE